MKKLLLMVLCMGLIMSVSASVNPMSDWENSPKRGMKQAEEDGKNVLLFFSLGLTHKSDKEYFEKYLDTKEFKDYAKDSLVLISVDLNEMDNPDKSYREDYVALAKRYQITAVPTVLLVNSDGELLSEIKTASTPDGYVENIIMASTSLAWHTNMKEALKTAKEEDKPIFMLFTGSDWCKYCIILKDNVLETPEFKRYAAEKLVLMYIDSPAKFKLPKDVEEQNEALIKEYNIKGFPTIVILDSKGKKIGQIGGASTAKAFIDSIEKVIK